MRQEEWGAREGEKEEEMCQRSYSRIRTADVMTRSEATSPDTPTPGVFSDRWYGRGLVISDRKWR